MCSLFAAKSYLLRWNIIFFVAQRAKVFVSQVYFCKLMCIWSGEVVRLGSTTAGDVVPCPCSLAQWDVATRADTHRNFHHSLAATTLSLLYDIKCSIDNTYYSNLVYIQLLMQVFFTI